MADFTLDDVKVRDLSLTNNAMIKILEVEDISSDETIAVKKIAGRTIRVLSATNNATGLSVAFEVDQADAELELATAAQTDIDVTLVYAYI